MSSSLKESLFGKSERSDGELFQPVLSSATTVAEADKPTRLGFIRKVYGILSIQLAVTAFICALAMKLTSPGLVGGYHILSFGTFLASAQWFQWLTFGLSLILLLCLFAFAYKHPLNMILLTLWYVSPLRAFFALPRPPDQAFRLCTTQLTCSRCSLFCQDRRHVNVCRDFMRDGGL